MANSFFYSKTFLTLVSLVSILLITVPSYSNLFVNNSGKPIAQEQDKIKQITLAVLGMTCTSCELHIEREVGKLKGVSFVKASYANGSTTVRFDQQKIKPGRIIEAINKSGYKVEQEKNQVTLLEPGNCCVNGTCKDHVGKLPHEINKDLKVVTNVSTIKEAFNQAKGKTKFVAILSSTCGWCLQGAESVQHTIVEQMKSKELSVMIIWTNMLKTDDQGSAYQAASLFRDPHIAQFFDAQNIFGDIVAQRLNPFGAKAWDIYMFFDKETQWSKDFPRPFDYVHQLNSAAYPRVDKSKYFCGNELTNRLNEILITL